MGKKDFVKMYADWLLADIKHNELMMDDIKADAQKNIATIIRAYELGRITVNEAIRYLNNDIFDDIYTGK